MARRDVQIEERVIGEVSVVVPVGDGPGDGFEKMEADAGRVMLAELGVHVNAHLGESAAYAFLRIRNGLRDRSAKLGNGRPVYSNADALRWMMERVAEASDA